MTLRAIERTLAAIAAALMAAVVAPSWPALADHPGDLEAGKKVYEETCVACHGPDGKGAIPGIPDLGDGKSSPLVTKSDSVLLRHILEGFQDSKSPLSMPPKGGNDNLTIRDIQNVLKYLHEKFHYAHKGHTQR